MTLKTCLLLSDDPDDHVEFAEALEEVSENYVLMAVCDPAKAVQLLALKKLAPDMVIVDFALGGFDADRFFEALHDNAELSHMSVVGYGDSSNLSFRFHPRMGVFLEDDISYSGLRKALARLLNGAASA